MKSAGKSTGGSHSRLRTEKRNDVDMASTRAVFNKKPKQQNAAAGDGKAGGSGANKENKESGNERRRSRRKSKT